MDYLEQLAQDLGRIFSFGLVNFLAAVLILIVGYLIAKLVEWALVRILKRTDVDNRLARAMGQRDTEMKLEEAIAKMVFYIIMLFVLIAFLQRLNLTIVTDPLNRLLGQIFTFLPRLIGAAIILFVGYLIARVLRRLVTNIASGLGADRLAHRFNVPVSLSWLLGTLVYALILIPTVIAALNALQIDAISQPATLMLERLLAAIPDIFGAAVLLGIAYFVARLVAGIVRDLLAGLGFDNLIARMGLARLTPGAQTPSQITGHIVLVAIMLFAAIEAADLLGFATLAAILTRFLIFGGQVLLALVIFAIGFYLANLARNLILANGGDNALLMAGLARTAILVFTGAMALRELGLADEIVNLAFGLTLGAIAVAAALAFGLGSREIAGREVERMVDRARALPPVPPTPSRTTLVGTPPEDIPPTTPR
jgi:hypothetical protein